MLAFAILILLCVGATALVRPFRLTAGTSRTVLRASSPEVDAIRQRMQSDPSYNPMTDPEAMAAIESLIPEELKEIPNAVARLKVAMTDAQSVSGLEDAAKKFTNKGDLISSPTSEWFQQSMPADSPAFSESELADVVERVRSSYPGAFKQ